MPFSFYTKVVGVTYQNPEGADRQKILKKCREGERLVLKREYNNPQDRDAIGVFRMNGEQIGHISSDICSSGPEQEGLAEAMDMGCNAFAEIKNITGGYGDKPTYGCNIIVTRDHDSPHIAESAMGWSYIREAQGLEKTDPKRSIEKYYKAIEYLDTGRALYAQTKYAELHPSTVSDWGKYPINRLSLLLEREGRYKECLDLLNEYLRAIKFLPFTEQETVNKRRTRVIKKIENLGPEAT